MKLGRWSGPGTYAYGVEVGDEWYDLLQALGSLDDSALTEASLRQSSRSLVLAAPIVERAVTQGKFDYRARLDVAKLELMAPVWGDVTIYCASLNYHSHIRETGLETPEKPFFFIKPTRCVVGPSQLVELPWISEKPDYEGELAVVIGRPGKYIDPDQAMNHVAGYTILNDISFRDLQVERSGDRIVVNWVAGKGLDTSAPTGPYFVTRDEVGDPTNRRLIVTVNDEIRQDCNTSDMVFGVAELIAGASQGITLDVGDVIATGTCGGVGSATQRFLKVGDSVSVQIEGVGRLTHGVTSETAARQ